MSVRRVTTGHDSDGKAVFLDDGEVQELTFDLLPGAVFQQLWSTQMPPTVPVDEVADLAGPYFPGPGGVRVTQIVFPPMTGDDAVSYEDMERAAAEIEAELPGMLAVMEPENPGMHTTDTVDVAMVQSGEVWLELDDGEIRRVKAGDVVIQNGTRHRWENRAEEPCVVTFILVGAHRS